jgi:long-chain acyl-CoA synthetase
MNLADLVEEGIRKFGEYNACQYEGRWHTNVELNLMANRLGNALKSIGIGRGDRVVTQLPNCIEIYVAFTAVYRIGAVMVPMNPILRPDQISYIYQDCGAKATITTSEYLPWIEEARKSAVDLEHVILVDKDGVPGTRYLPDLLSGSSDVLKSEEMDNDDLAALIYTSGTTGNPKGVMHTHYSLWVNAACFVDYQTLSGPTTLTTVSRDFSQKTYTFVREEHEVTGPDRKTLSLTALPLCHSFGIAFYNFGCMVGARSVMMRWWDPVKAMMLIETMKIKYMALVPTMYVQMLEHPEFGRYDLSSLKYCISGGAALAPEIGLKWKEKVGTHIIEGWGMTETGASTTGNNLFGPPKYGSIGLNMLRCNTMRVFDSYGKELPPGRSGELVVKGPAMMKGYWNLPEETAQTIKNGWLYTGDIGYMDEDGYFYITGRKKDLIIRGGENVSPKEVETVVCSHPKVAEVGCVGVKDRVYGEEIKVFVVLKPGQQCTDVEIIEFCKKSLPTFKLPKQVQFIQALPKNVLGKTLRAELRKLG